MLQRQPLHFTVLYFAVFFLFQSINVWAFDISRSEKDALAYKVANVVYPSETLEQTSEIYRKIFLDPLMAHWMQDFPSDGKALEPLMRQSIDASFSTYYHNIVTHDILRTIIMEYYTEQFSGEELQALDAFYNTNAGHEVIAVDLLGAKNINREIDNVLMNSPGNLLSNWDNVKQLSFSKTMQDSEASSLISLNADEKKKFFASSTGKKYMEVQGKITTVFFDRIGDRLNSQTKEIDAFIKQQLATTYNNLRK